MPAYYVHDLSPYLVRFSENWGIRYYGLAYVLGFVAAYAIIRWLVRHDYYRDLREEQVGDMITWAAILGVMLGGRLGYMLIYNLDGFLANPITFFYLLDGGMASHGGIAGLVVFTWFYARRHRISWTGLGDQLCVAAPLALFFGRMANFINGELYGRPTTVAWAVQFPDELKDPAFAETFHTIAMRVQGRIDAEDITRDAIIEAARHDQVVRDVLAEHLTPRHPSQIYEALLEGLALFAILMAVRLRFRNLPNGILTGLFFVLYAVFRIIGEQFRFPESGFGPFGLTMGQFLSTFMIVVGAGFIGVALWRRREREIPSP